jgi:hypothetical protein
MVIKILFANPIEVSANAKQDLIMIDLSRAVNQSLIKPVDPLVDFEIED